MYLKTEHGSSENNTASGDPVPFLKTNFKDQQAEDKIKQYQTPPTKTGHSSRLLNRSTCFLRARVYQVASSHSGKRDNVGVADDTLMHTYGISTDT